MNLNVIGFWEQLKTVNDREYLRSVILFSAAPTIAGLKPATLICLGNADRDLSALWNRGRVAQPLCRLFGLEFFCLAQFLTGVQVLFFRRALLEKRLTQKQCRLFLAGRGYPASGPLNGLLSELRTRFSAGIPHEIGIFLGFPLDDVLGFEAHQGEGYLLNGYWKVYSQPVAAQITFSLYDQAKQAMLTYLKWIRITGRQVEF